MKFLSFSLLYLFRQNKISKIFFWIILFFKYNIFFKHKKLLNFPRGCVLGRKNKVEDLFEYLLCFRFVTPLFFWLMLTSLFVRILSIFNFEKCFPCEFMCFFFFSSLFPLFYFLSSLLFSWRKIKSHRWYLDIMRCLTSWHASKINMIRYLLPLLFTVMGFPLKVIVLL